MPEDIEEVDLDAEPAGKITIVFPEAGSTEFSFEVEGEILPTQMIVACERLLDQARFNRTDMQLQRTAAQILSTLMGGRSPQSPDAKIVLPGSISDLKG